MDQEKFTILTQELLNNAVKIAQEKSNPLLLPIHILAAMVEDSFCINFFKELNINLGLLKNLINQEINKLPHVTNSQLAGDNILQDFLNQAKINAEKMGDKYVSLEHILLTLSETPGLPADITEFFKKAHFTRNNILNHMHFIRKGKTVDNPNAENQYQTLEKYCINITQQAKDGLLDPVIGRHEEIRRIIQLLSRRTKNNPILIGEPGVGKTAIVEGIAQRIINNDVPESLKNNTVYALDLGLLIAGAKYQGEFEDRLKNVLKEIEKNQDTIILFIDEIHMLVGAGATTGAMDASNLLKPALARGTLHCIGATTLKEYKKYIEKDAALERRFQKLLVPEPTIEDAVSILRGLKEKYEIHHGIHIKDKALVDAVLLSAKNIPDRFLPDKAIDLVDEAAAMVKMAIDSQPEELDKIERKIRQLEIEKLALEKEQTEEISKKRLQELEVELINFKEKQKVLLTEWKSQKAPLEMINKLKEKIEQLQQQFIQAERDGNFAKASEIKYGSLMRAQQDLEKEKLKLKDLKTHMIKEDVTEHDIAMVLSRHTGIPVEKLQTKETEKLINMDKELEKRVIGQEEAITVISNAIQMHRTGIIDPNKPIGSFLFLGPTGVGKTEVARALADFLFNNAKTIIRIDMSEYMEKHAVARLIGAPPGYVGYEEGGQLTEAVRRQPYSVVLFDEIEKAHPDVFNIFLQILDEGHLTDSQGRTVSFKNSIIIMTSNLGSQIILEAPVLDHKIKAELEKIIHHNFKPEFLNRIDATVFFRKLSLEDVEKIAQLQLKEVQKRLLEKNIVLEISPVIFKFIAEVGYQPEYGARPLKRAIQNYISIPVSKYILQNPDKKNIRVILQDKNIVIE